MNAHKRVVSYHVAGHFARISELASIQCFQFPDHGFGRPYIGYQNMGFIIASDKEVTSAAIVVL